MKHLHLSFAAKLTVLLLLVTGCGGGDNSAKKKDGKSSKSAGKPTKKSTAGKKTDKGNSRMLVFIGTYTGEKSKSKGIYTLELDTSNGELKQVNTPAESENPSFLAIHPNKKYLYAVNELEKFQGKENNGAVSAFEIDAATGSLKLLNQLETRGALPCHLVVDKSGKAVLVANYMGGSVAAYPVLSDGKLGKLSSYYQHQGSSIKPRQTAPHAHSINIDVNNKIAAVADLGMDAVLLYKFDAEKAWLSDHEPKSVKVKAGAGPRHFAFHPNGKFAYVINEMNCTITAFAYDGKKGALSELETVSTLPKGQEFEDGFSTAEVQVTPSGKFLYGSNRGHNTIVAFKIGDDGKLTYVENESSGGKMPRNFGIDPTEKYLLAANNNSNDIFVFKINPNTGALDPTGKKITIPRPVCVKFLQP